MIRGLRTRIVLAATLVYVVALLGASFLTIRVVERDAQESAEAVVAEALAENSKAFGISPGDEVYRVGSNVGFGAFSRQGELAFGSVFVEGELVAEAELNLTSRTVNELNDPVSGQPIQDQVLRDDLARLTLVISDLDASESEQLLVGAPSPAEIEVSVEAAKSALSIVVPTVLVGTIVLSWLLVGRALQPVEAITRRVQEISTSSLDQRVPEPNSHDEIAELAETLNAMLERLERSDARQKQFSADVSHELKSPLSTVRAAAELIDLHPGLAPEMTLEIVEGADRLTTMIDDMLLIASEEAALDQPESTLDRAATVEPVDLVELCRQLVSGTTATLVAPEPVVVQAHQSRLERAISNLVDNAERHARQAILVTVEIRSGTVVLAVEDDGAGVRKQDRQTVFERFVRLDVSRSRESGGSGLGLALARSVSEAHGGSLTVDESPALGGARFVLTLPLGHD